ncbi:MAG: FAD-binding protein [Alphaproteobacteria bacterium]|nr:FAD-binding protein [Alphaproteobacteria bacterium]
MKSSASAAEVASKLRDVLGPQAVLTGADVSARHSGWVGAKPCEAAAILRPHTTAEVASVLRACNEAGQPIVPLGGGTGLVEGQEASPHELVLSLERMNHIEKIDPQNRIAFVQAGVPMQALQEAATAEGLFFPIDLGARGSATIGGNISTNAGGNRVIRYGMTRENILGLEAVLADGTVLSSMNQMIKNNAGYDLKQLFIGSEGTLGVVTRAVVRLREAPASEQTALLAISDYASVIALLRAVDKGLGGTLSSFEVMWRSFYDLVTQPPAKGRPPIKDPYPYYVLIEAQGGEPEHDMARFEALLGTLLEQGLVADAVIAKSAAERDALWGLRDDVLQVAQFWPIFTFDVSMPVSTMETYVAEFESELARRHASARHVIFGHLGDGNLHVIVGVGDASAAARRSVESIVYEPLRARSGSVSAEHGIGLEKRAYLGLTRSPEEIATMRLLKSALDPKGILNPGKILGSGPSVH